jgi:hypothetical protein
VRVSPAPAFVLKRKQHLFMGQLQAGAIFVLGVLLVVTAHAGGQDLSGNAYRVITGHNSFGLTSAPDTITPDPKTPPPEIIFDGIAVLFGDKRALFKTQATPQSPARFYYLSEGQREGQIELLAIDLKRSTIKVNNYGVIQTIALCDPPALNAATSADGGNGNFANTENLKTSPAGNAQMPGGKNQEAPAGNDAAVANGAASASDVSWQMNGGVNSANDAAPKNNEPYSLRAAREFEQLRLQTADAVLAGTDEPIPLTPLTPPGTSPALIGPDKAWFPE